MMMVVVYFYAFQTISENFCESLSSSTVWLNVSNVQLNFSLLSKLKECFDLTLADSVRESALLASKVLSSENFHI